VAIELSLDRTTISRNVKLLIEAGWVDAVDTTDKRERLLSFNKAGQKIISDALPYIKKAQALVEAQAEPFVKTSTDRKLLQALENLQQVASEISEDDKAFA